MNATKLLAFVLLGTAIALSNGSAPGGKCPTVEYLTALGSCMGEYSKTLFKVMGPKVTNKLESAKKFIQDTCKENGLMERTLTCIDQVYKMCDYSILDIELLRTMQKTICKKVDIVEQFGKCKVDLQDMSTYAKSIVIDPNDPICSSIKASEKYTKSVLAKCPADVLQLIDILLKPLSQVYCNKEAKANKCSLFVYTAASQICYAAPTAQATVAILKRVVTDGGVKIGSTLDILCQKLGDGFPCHVAVDKRCGMSLINTKKVKKAFESLCAVSNKVLSITQCIDLNYRVGVACAMKEIEKSDDICKLFGGIKKCFESMYSKCSAPIKKLMDDTYDLMVPSPCDSSDKTCSLLDQMGSTALCSVPSFMWMASKYYKGLMVQKKDCDKTSLMKSEVCQLGLTEMCKGSFIAPKRFTEIMLTICNTQVIEKRAKCSNGMNLMKGLYGDCPGMKLTKNPVNSQKDLCRMIRAVRQCSSGQYTKDNCDSAVSKFSRVVTAELVPAQCGKVKVWGTGENKENHATSVIHASLFVTTLVAAASFLVTHL